MPFDLRNRALARNGATGGFTLIEVLVAIAIAGVATGLMVQTIFRTVELSRDNSSHRVAASLASEQLRAIVNVPSNFVWPDAAALAEGALVELSLPGEDPEHDLRAVAAPATLPTDHRSILREQSFFERYSWRAFARLPQAEAGYVEVTVSIEWVDSGREKNFALTGTMPRSRLGAIL